MMRDDLDCQISKRKNPGNTKSISTEDTGSSFQKIRIKN